MAIQSAYPQTMEQFLVGNQYYIPDYQREYAWEDDKEIQDFWHDLVNTKEQSRSHFFGQIVIHQENGRFNIIDGQQRITTSIIFLAAVRDIYEKYIGDDVASTEVNAIINQYIGTYSENRRGIEDKLKLYLGEINRSYFRENIQTKAPTSIKNAKTPSQKRIFKAYDTLHNKLTAMIEHYQEDTEKIDKLTDLYTAFIKKFVVIVVITNDLNEAYVIFETVNARGKELQTADLLKNYLFMNAGRDINEVKNCWKLMLDTLENKDDATKFIRCYWNAYNTFVRETELYRAISIEVNETNCLRFVRELSKYTELYNALSSPQDNTYFTDNDISEKLENIKVMGITLYYPLIFSLVRVDCIESKIKKVIEAIEVLAFRNYIVGHMKGNTYEVRFSQIANKVSRGEYSVIDVLKEIRNITLQDDEFFDRLKGIEISRSQSQVAKYILREIEDYGDGEKKTSRNTAKIHVEHIMPKKYDDWSIPQEIAEKCIDRLANQTIMLDEYNKKASNKTFDEKKKYYIKSTIKITRELLKYSEWNLDTINEREEAMIPIIQKRWALIDY